MSHLTILPTALRDLELLDSALRSLGFVPQGEGWLSPFPGDGQPVDLQLTLPDGSRLGWRRQSDGSLALVGDLPRLSQAPDGLPNLLARIGRAYAAHLALREAATFPEGVRVAVAPLS
ncbi:MAG: DUF1257 domain-containing protein [Cyanobacteriota bacterium]|nr:DUF1257 domain-containing protein [Cyanobacteriota bacterium]